MKYGAAEIDISVVHRLLGEEVVYGVLDSISNVCRSLLLSFADDRLIKIL